MLLRRASSASLLEPLIQAWADIPLGKWRHVRVTVRRRELRVDVAGWEALAMRVDRDTYSPFGVHVSQAKARFKNLTVHALGTDATARTDGTQPGEAPMTPAGGPAEARP